jgi:hypothetical protein
LPSLLRVAKGSAAFHDVNDYERLVDIARSIDPRTLIFVLLGGAAGRPVIGMIALEWGDVDLATGTPCGAVDWNGFVTSPKAAACDACR